MYFFITQAQNPDITNDKFLLNDDLQSWYVALQWLICLWQMDIETPTMSGKIPMVRIRNPWGNEAEWKGRWSDQ